MTYKTLKKARGNIFFAFFAALAYYLRFLFDPEIDKNINPIIRKNIPESKDFGSFRLRRLQYELIKNMYFYGFWYQDYFSFDLRNKSRREKLEYVGEWEKMFFLKSISSAETQEKFNNKYLCYKTFKQYYKRDVVEIADAGDLGEFIRFTGRHGSFMIKPETYSLGVGIRIIDTDRDSDIGRIFADILAGGRAVAEELVRQDEAMAAYHPASVNTIRFVTAYNSGRVEYVYALLRMGVGESVVDNVYGGGVVARVDTETGEVMTAGCKKYGETVITYDAHPDTNVKIKGSRIPRWNELLDTINELVRVVPEQKYVGWDMALTDGGWVMIEGNTKPSFASIQICSGRGFRQRFDQIKDFLGADGR